MVPSPAHLQEIRYSVASHFSGDMKWTSKGSYLSGEQTIKTQGPKNIIYHLLLSKHLKTEPIFWAPFFNPHTHTPRHLKCNAEFFVLICAAIHVLPLKPEKEMVTMHRMSILFYVFLYKLSDC